MEYRESRPEPGSLAVGLPTQPGLARRMRNMVLVWLFFGVLVGPGSAPPNSGVIGVISGVIAGMLLLPFLGAALGLMGGRAREALLGGVCGLLVGTAMGLGEGAILTKVNPCLIVGGLIGATFPGMWQLLVMGWMTVARASFGHPATGATARMDQTASSAAIRP